MRSFFGACLTAIPDSLHIVASDFLLEQAGSSEEFIFGHAIHCFVATDLRD